MDRLWATIGIDGDPRVIPVAFLWDGARLTVCTVPRSAKVPALRRNPRVAIILDTEGHPRVCCSSVGRRPSSWSTACRASTWRRRRRGSGQGSRSSTLRASRNGPNLVGGGPHGPSGASHGAAETTTDQAPSTRRWGGVEAVATGLDGRRTPCRKGPQHLLGDVARPRRPLEPLGARS